MSDMVKVTPKNIVDEARDMPWKVAIEPFRVAPRVYYVGNVWVGSFLVDTEEGLAIIDTTVMEDLYLLLESIRKLRMRVAREMEEKGYKTLMVTSSVPGEGKTTIAANLAVALARQGKKVILVDCDARNPSLAHVLRRTAEHPGLGQVMRGEGELDTALGDVSGDSSNVLRVL